MEDDDPKGVPHRPSRGEPNAEAVGQTLGRVPPVPVGDELQRGGNVGFVFLDEIKVLQMINVKGKYGEIILLFQARA